MIMLFVFLVIELYLFRTFSELCECEVYERSEVCEVGVIIEDAA